MSSGMTVDAADEPEIPVLPPGEDELPSDDGEPMETNRHRQQMTLLIQSLKRAWSHRHDYFVGGNMFVYFSELQVKHNDFRGPDVFVALDTTDRDRRSWVAWGENGKLPDVVIELLSDRTRHIDRGEKMRIYSRLWRTAQYFLYDPWSHELEGYHLDSDSGDYLPLQPDQHGHLPCHRLGLAVGLHEGPYEGVRTTWLRWFSDAGILLPTAEEGADAEKERADAEKERADAERERADAERERADAERERAVRAERRAQELEQQLKAAREPR
jgi:Uma2 family endonuclease